MLNLVCSVHITVILAVLTSAVQCAQSLGVQLQQQHNGQQPLFGSVYQAVSQPAALRLPSLSRLRAAIDAAGLADALSAGDATYTIFAPSDDAFASALAELRITEAELLSNVAALAELIKYHVVPAAAIIYEQLPQGGTTVYPTLAGDPDQPEASHNLAVVRAPAAAAAVKSGSGALLRVIAIGSGSEARVIAHDVRVGKSVIHVVDAVLYPFYRSLAQAMASIPALTSFAAIARGSGLLPSLNDPGLSRTLFAPTDQGIAATGAALDLDLAALAAGSSAFAASLLQYHTLSGMLALSGLDGSETHATLLSGKALGVSRSETGEIAVQTVSLVDATVTVADIPIGWAGRSVLHIIDRALFPEYASVAQAVSAPGTTLLLVALLLADDHTGSSDEEDHGSSSSSGANNGSSSSGGGLLEQLNDPQWSGTLFAPSDAAFRRLLEASGRPLEQLLADRPLLRRLLRAHVVPGRALASGVLREGQQLRTLLALPQDAASATPQGTGLMLRGKGFGARLATRKAIKAAIEPGGIVTIDAHDGALQVKAADGTTAHIVTPDVSVNFGKAIVHVIDTVLLTHTTNEEP